MWRRGVYHDPDTCGHVNLYGHSRPSYFITLMLTLHPRRLELDDNKPRLITWQWVTLWEDVYSTFVMMILAPCSKIEAEQDELKEVLVELMHEHYRFDLFPLLLGLVVSPKTSLHFLTKKGPEGPRLLYINLECT